jgi:hypothetical protein
MKTTFLLSFKNSSTFFCICPNLNKLCLKIFNLQMFYDLNGPCALIPTLQYIKIIFECDFGFSKYSLCNRIHYGMVRCNVYLMYFCIIITPQLKPAYCGSLPRNFIIDVNSSYFINLIYLGLFLKKILYEKHC